MHITKSPSLPPRFFAYCKWSKTAGLKGLGTRLIYNCSSLFISVPYLNCTIRKAVVKALALVWSMAYSDFVPCGLKTGDATSLKQYVLCSIKQRLKLRKSSKEKARCRITLVGASECQETKHEPSINLRKPWDNLINIWALVLSGLVSSMVL